MFEIIYFPYNLNIIIEANKSGDLEIVCAAPKCNSFFQKGYIKHKIPIMYRIAMMKWVELSKKVQRKIQVKEYTRDNWTYHAKGVFFRNQNGKKHNYL